jgi:subtilisin family serine protease
MDPLRMVNLTALMDRTLGDPALKIGLIDGPVEAGNPDLASERVRALHGTSKPACRNVNTEACGHGTFVAGILAARRGSAAPAVCPGCTLLIRPIFPETATRSDEVPIATPAELARAIVECIDVGARLLNLSSALIQASQRDEHVLAQALNYAASQGVIVVAAARNQGSVGGTSITNHSWVIPVVSYDMQGRPMAHSNLGRTIGRQGLGAPGDGITSIDGSGKPMVLAGTSAAAPFVTGAIALLWSLFPTTSAAQIKAVTTSAHQARRPTIVPPLMDAWNAYQMMRRA